MLNGYFSNSNRKERDPQNPAHSSRASRFESNWGKESPQQKLPRRVDYGRTDLQAQAQQDLHAEIITGCQTTKMSAAQSKISGELSKESIAFLKTFRDKHDNGAPEQQICDLSPRDMLILLFELLKVYAYEYNSAVGLGPFHLELSRPLPLLEKGASARTAQDPPAPFQASMNTSTHSLTMRADQDAVRFYVLPLEHALGLNKNGPDFEPDSLLQMKIKKRTIYWETKAGMPLTMSRVDATCRALFQWLIERTADRVAGI